MLVELLAFLRHRELSVGGHRGVGEVVASSSWAEEETAHDGRDRPTAPRREIIEFTAADGQVVRGRPAASAVATLHREGRSIAVHYHRERPERFLAPRDGERISPRRLLISLSLSGVMVVSAAAFLVIVHAMPDLFGAG